MVKLEKEEEKDTESVVQKPEYIDSKKQILLSIEWIIELIDFIIDFF